MSATTSAAQNELTSWDVPALERTTTRVNSKGYAGRVRAHRAQLVNCQKCHQRRLNLHGPHAPHLVHRDGAWVEIDCVGDLVQR